MHQSFKAASFTSWGQEYKFLLRNPRALLALVQTLLTCRFHLKSLVIVTPRYLMLSTFSRSVPSKVYEAWIFLSGFLSAASYGSSQVEISSPLPCPGTQLINIPLKFHCVFFILNFMIANTVISKKSYFSSISEEMFFMYGENNKGPRTVPWGTPDKTGVQSDFTPFTTTCCLKQRKESVHFNVLPPIS